MALGYYRRIYLSVSSFLYLALKGYFKNTGRTFNVGWGWSCEYLVSWQIQSAETWALQVWSSYSVLNVLYSLMQKSKVNEYIIAQREGKSPEEIAYVADLVIIPSRPLTWCFSDIVGEYGQRPLYRMLGYFSIIGLLRVHVHLGDFTLALKVMDNVELNQKVGCELIIINISY